MTILQKIQKNITDRNYYLSSHAEEEMLDDDLNRKDVENAISYHHNRVRLIGDLMRCEFCDGETIKKRVKRHHWFEERLYIIENVGVEVCVECGEKYFHAKTLDAIDEFLSGDHPVKDRMEVEIVSLDPAAA